MGGTLPVLVRFMSESVEESGRNVATLYLLNSFGTVIGSLLGGFFFVPMAGLRATVISAGIVNIVIGAVAYVLARLKPTITAAAEPAAASPEQSASDLHVRLAVAIAGTS